MNKKILYLFIPVIVVVISIMLGINTKNSIFIVEKLEDNSNAYRKIYDNKNEFIKENGIFLLQTEEEKEIYLILDGSHINLNREVPYFSDVIIENKEDTIRIYFNEELKNYKVGKYPENILIYKITKDKDYEYIQLFKNGEETHFDSIIGG
jgi:hypothetical protein